MHLKGGAISSRIETLLKLANRLAVDIVALFEPVEETGRANRASYSTRGRPRRSPAPRAVHEPRGRGRK